MSPTRRLFLGSLAAAGWSSMPVIGAPVPVLLARDARPDMDPRGWLVSEKLDGVRALWDGERLRFRSGRAITAPAWFTAALPQVPLDGELWGGRGRFEQLSGTVRREQPSDDAWREVRYQVFDLPEASGPFLRRAALLRHIVRQAAWPALGAVEQFELPDAAALRHRLAAVVREGGEGLMLHRADALRVAGRSDALVKLKPVQDAEAVVEAHEPGQGRHAGRLGALRVRAPDGRRFLLGTGFSDAQRERPPLPGSVVTYTYRGVTESGLPRFASFLRVREDG
jgi:DNA ligase-1